MKKPQCIYDFKKIQQGDVEMYYPDGINILFIKSLTTYRKVMELRFLSKSFLDSRTH